MGQVFDKILITIFIGLVISFSGFDLVSDFRSHADFGHLVGEGVLLGLGVIIFVRVWIQSIKFKKENVVLEVQLKKSQEELAQWTKKNQEILNGFSEAINSQFLKWNLTSAEKEVALLLLKGFSLKEIAEFRKVSERTVRQQSIEVYRKSNLSGRAEFAAFFLDDLILPKS